MTVSAADTHAQMFMAYIALPYILLMSHNVNVGVFLVRKKLLIIWYLAWYIVLLIFKKSEPF